MLVLPSFPLEGRLCVVSGPTLITSHQPLASQGDHFTPAISGNTRTVCSLYEALTVCTEQLLQCCSAAGQW